MAVIARLPVAETGLEKLWFDNFHKPFDGQLDEQVIEQLTKQCHSLKDLRIWGMTTLPDQARLSMIDLAATIIDNIEDCTLEKLEVKDLCGR